MKAGEIDALGNLLLHDQVTTRRGIDVDAGLSELLESLWDCGFTTFYSCQGGHDFTPELPYVPAFIAWSFDQAYRFTHETILRGVSKGVIDIQRAGGCFRAQWDPAETDTITKVWRA